MDISEKEFTATMFEFIGVLAAGKLTKEELLVLAASYAAIGQLSRQDILDSVAKVKEARA